MKKLNVLLIIICSIIFSNVAISAEVKLKLIRKKGRRVIFLLGEESRMTLGEDYSIYLDHYKIGVVTVDGFNGPGTKLYGIISSMKKKLLENKTYVLKNKSRQRSFNRGSALLEYKKNFSHLFILENTTKSFSHAQELSSGVSGAGKIVMEEPSYGMGYEHLFSVMEDRFRMGATLTYELSRDISYSHLSFSDGTSIGGKGTSELSHIWTFYGNFSVPIQQSFDLYVGVNYSELLVAGNYFDSFGYHAGLAAMKDRFRLGVIYRTNVYKGDANGGPQKFIANSLLLTLGFIF